MKRRLWALTGSCAALLACRIALGIGDLPFGDAGVDGDTDVPTSDAGPSDGLPLGATVIASTQQSPVAIAVDSVNVYWINASGAVLDCPKTGCTGAPNVITTFSGNGQKDALLFAIAVDSNNVYFVVRTPTDPVELMKCAIAGCGNSPTTLLTQLAHPSIGLAGNELFTVANVQNDSGMTTHAVVAVNVDTSSSTTFAVDPNAVGVVVHGNTVYWSSFDTQSFNVLRSCPVSGCTGTPAVVLNGQYAIGGGAVNDTSLYASFMTISNGVGVLTCPLSGCGSSPEQLVSGLVGGVPSPILGLTSSKVYFMTKSGDQTPEALASCGLTGCSGTPTPVLPAPVDAFAVDDANVYWVDTDAGTVMRASL